jgi:hypothetical protein
LITLVIVGLLMLVSRPWDPQWYNRYREWQWLVISLAAVALVLAVGSGRIRKSWIRKS